MLPTATPAADNDGRREAGVLSSRACGPNESPFPKPEASVAYADIRLSSLTVAGAAAGITHDAYTALPV